MAIIFSDNFARSDRPLAGDNGWSGWGSGLNEIVSGRVRQTGSNPSAKQSHGSRTQVAIEATLDRTGSAFETNLLLKSASGTSDIADAWMAYINNGTVQICDGWSTLSGSTVSNTHTPGDRYRFGLVESGGSTTLSVWKNGVLLTSVTTGSVKTGTWGGVHAGSQGSTTHHFDDFQIEDTAAPATGPTASAGADQSVTTGSTVTLSGSATGGTAPYSYAWTQLSGTTVTLSSSSAQAPTFTAPGGAGTLSFRVTVADAASQTSTDDVTITVSAPVAPTITTTTLGTLTQGVAVTVPISITGTAPITLAVQSGALPAGMSVSGSSVVGTPSATGTGTVTLRATNTAGYDDQVYSWTVSSGPYIAATDANIVYSHGNWLVDGSGAHTLDSCAELSALITSDSIVANFTIPALYYSWQWMAYRVNGGQWVGQLVASASNTPAASTLALTIDLDRCSKRFDTNLIEIRWYPQMDGWSVAPLTFHGFTVESGDGTVAQTPRALNVLVAGTSFVRGGSGTGVDGDESAGAAFEGWASALRYLMPANVGVVGKGGQAMGTSGVGNGSDAVPPIESALPYLYSGQARDFTGTDVVVFRTRGSVSGVPGMRTLIESTIAPIRAFSETLPIVWLSHISGDNDNVSMMAAAALVAADDPYFIVPDQAGWEDSSGRSPNEHWLGWYDNAIYAPKVAQAVMEAVYQPTVTFVPAASWPPAADSNPLHFYARVT